MQFFEEGNVVIFSKAIACRSPFTHSVHGQNGCFFERRRIKRRSRVRFMVLCKENISIIVNFFFYNIWNVKLFTEPKWHSLKPRAKPSWGNGQIAHKESLKSQERLIIKNNMIQLMNLYASFFKTIFYCVFRKSWIMLLPGKAFLLRCRKDLSIFEETCRAVMVEC